MPTTPTSSVREANKAQRATSSRHVIPEAPTASVGGGGSTPTEGVDADADASVGGELPPAHGVGLAPDEALDGDLDRGAARGLADRAGEAAPVRREHDDRIGRRRDGLVEREPDLGGRDLDTTLLGGRRSQERRVRTGDAGHDERREQHRDEGTPHGTGTPPASSDRCPKIGATSRSENSITAIATHVAANPYAHTERRGRKAAPSGKTAAMTMVQPIA